MREGIFDILLDKILHGASTREDRAAFSEALKESPERRREFREQAYLLVLLQAHPELFYPREDANVRPARLRASFWWKAAAAAIPLIGLSVLFGFSMREKKQEGRPGASFHAASTGKTVSRREKPAEPRREEAPIPVAAPVAESAPPPAVPAPREDIQPFETQNETDTERQQEDKTMNTGMENGILAKTLAAAAVVSMANSLAADTLTWNGGDGAVWDMTTSNWLDSASQPAAWTNGASARFATAGTVSLATNVSTPLLSFASGAGTVTLTNGAIELTGSALILASNDLAVIASPLSGMNGLTLVGAENEYFPDSIPSDDAVIFAGVKLSDIRELSAAMDGGYINNKGYRATPCFYSNDGSTLTVQFQLFDRDWTKCVKIQLTQSGADVIGHSVYARYHEAAEGNFVGTDFDTSSEVSTGAGNRSGYLVCRLRATLNPAAERRRVVIAGNAALTGAVNLVSGVLSLEGAGRLAEGCFAGDITNNGILLAKSDGGQILSGTISGLGTVITESGSAVTNLSENTGYLQTTNTVFFPNMRLARVTGVTGEMYGNTVTHYLPYPYTCTSFYFENDGQTGTAQMQFYDSSAGGIYLKCVKIQLTQTGADIAAKVLYASYINATNTDKFYGMDFDRVSRRQNVATADNVNGYGIHKFGVVCGSVLTLAAAAANTYSGGTFVNGGKLAIARQYALPIVSGASIVVNDGGTLLFGCYAENWNGVGGANPVSVRKGGTLLVERSFVTGTVRLFSNDGGTISFLQRSPDCFDADNYANQLILANGARVTGSPFRFGNSSPLFLTVTGTVACAIDSGISLVRGALPATLDVADVTGDTNTDLTIRGPVYDYYDQRTTNYIPYAGSTLLKKGAGTLSMSGQNAYTGITQVAEGTLILDAAGVLATNGPVTLAGGTLAVNAKGLSAGKLCVTTNSVLQMNGGTISFAASADSGWTGDLLISGDLGKTNLRVGTDASGLTPAQIQRIHYGRHSVVITAEGYIRESPRGLVIKLM